MEGSSSRMMSKNGGDLSDDPLNRLSPRINLSKHQKTVDRSSFKKKKNRRPPGGAWTRPYLIGSAKNTARSYLEISADKKDEKITHTLEQGRPIGNGLSEVPANARREICESSLLILTNFVPFLLRYADLRYGTPESRQIGIQEQLF